MATIKEARKRLNDKINDVRELSMQLHSLMESWNDGCVNNIEALSRGKLLAEMIAHDSQEILEGRW